MCGMNMRKETDYCHAMNLKPRKVVQKIQENNCQPKKILKRKTKNKNNEKWKKNVLEKFESSPCKYYVVATISS